MKSVLFKIFRRVIVRPLSERGFGEIKWVASIYRWLVVRLVPNEDSIVEVNGYKMRVRLGKGYGAGGVAQSLTFEGEYEPQTTEVFKKIIKKGMNVVDIGANIGYYTLLFSKLVSFSGKVWAFEPEPQNFDDLYNNVRLNNRLYNVELSNLAISDKNDVAIMYTSKIEAGEHSLIACRSHNKQTIKVDTVGLDSVLSDKRIDVIKTDTEGNEMAVLFGAEKVLAQNRNIKLVVEFYPKGLNKAGYSVGTLWSWLVDEGFGYLYLIDEWERKIQKVSIGRIKRYAKQHGFSVNVLCSRAKVVL